MILFIHVVQNWKIIVRLFTSFSHFLSCARSFLFSRPTLNLCVCLSVCWVRCVPHSFLSRILNHCLSSIANDHISIIIVKDEQLQSELIDRRMMIGMSRVECKHFYIFFSVSIANRFFFFSSFYSFMWACVYMNFFLSHHVPLIFDLEKNFLFFQVIFACVHTDTLHIYILCWIERYCLDFDWFDRHKYKNDKIFVVFKAPSIFSLLHVGNSVFDLLPWDQRLSLFFGLIFSFSYADKMKCKKRCWKEKMCFMSACFFFYVLWR